MNATSSNQQNNIVEEIKNKVLEIDALRHGNKHPENIDLPLDYVEALDEITSIDRQEIEEIARNVIAKHKNIVRPTVKKKQKSKERGINEWLINISAVLVISVFIKVVFLSDEQASDQKQPSLFTRIAKVDYSGMLDTATGHLNGAVSYISELIATSTPSNQATAVISSTAANISNTPPATNTNNHEPTLAHNLEIAQPNNANELMTSSQTGSRLDSDVAKINPDTFALNSTVNQVKASDMASNNARDVVKFDDQTQELPMANIATTLVENSVESVTIAANPADTPAIIVTDNQLQQATTNSIIAKNIEPEAISKIENNVENLSNIHRDDLAVNADNSNNVDTSVNTDKTKVTANNSAQIAAENTVENTTDASLEVLTDKANELTTETDISATESTLQLAADSSEAHIAVDANTDVNTINNMDNRVFLAKNTPQTAEDDQIANKQQVNDQKRIDNTLTSEPSLFDQLVASFNQWINTAPDNTTKVVTTALNEQTKTAIKLIETADNLADNTSGLNEVQPAATLDLADSQAPITTETTELTALTELTDQNNEAPLLANKLADNTSSLNEIQPAATLDLADSQAPITTETTELTALTELTDQNNEAPLLADNLADNTSSLNEVQPAATLDLADYQAPITTETTELTEPTELTAQSNEAPLLANKLAVTNSSQNNQDAPATEQIASTKSTATVMSKLDTPSTDTLNTSQSENQSIQANAAQPTTEAAILQPQLIATTNIAATDSIDTATADTNIITAVNDTAETIKPSNVEVTAITTNDDTLANSSITPLNTNESIVAGNNAIELESKPVQDTAIETTANTVLTAVQANALSTKNEAVSTQVTTVSTATLEAEQLIVNTSSVANTSAPTKAINESAVLTADSTAPNDNLMTQTEEVSVQASSLKNDKIAQSNSAPITYAPISTAPPTFDQAQSTDSFALAQAKKDNAIALQENQTDAELDELLNIETAAIGSVVPQDVEQNALPNAQRSDQEAKTLETEPFVFEPLTNQPMTTTVMAQKRAKPTIDATNTNNQVDMTEQLSTIVEMAELAKMSVSEFYLFKNRLPKPEDNIVLPVNYFKAHPMVNSIYLSDNSHLVVELTDDFGQQTQIAFVPNISAQSNLIDWDCDTNIHPNLIANPTQSGCTMNTTTAANTEAVLSSSTALK
ncbi:hypothetical protein ACFOD0_03645 [Shewanella intestini]|uniref:Uncharacterized protein n=1 Tax=Shewanella intestini TaxID=2017544 RepID=A0ABS5I3Q5_9GAMM|nr:MULTISPECIES: hypothetical protein [Shewanella]MBR9728541.1 hypothetical protein [Shewanella intestini]MRG36360.1 hypothetical protein [Shewanella sp. XMDDZSB0408]